MAKDDKTGGTALTTPSADALQEVFTQANRLVAKTLPKHVTPERFLRIAWVLCNRTPGLVQAAEEAPETLIAAIVQCSELGLEPGREAHLVPFKNNKKGGRMEVQMIPDYRGLAELARRSGAVRFLDARLVYKGEKFNVQYGTDPKIEHVPNLDPDVDSSIQNIVCAYAVAHMTDGGPPKFEVVPRWKLDKVQASSKSQEGPWKTWPHEQRLKTAVKQVCKLLPQTPELVTALEVDNRFEGGEFGTVTAFDDPDVTRKQLAAKTRERADELKEKLGVGKIADSKREQQAPVQDDADVRREELELVAQETKGGKPKREAGED